MEFKRPKCHGPVSLAKSPRDGEHDVHGSSDNGGVDTCSNNVEDAIGLSDANSNFDDLISLSEQAVSSSGGVRIQQRASETQSGSSRDKVPSHDQLADKFDDAGLFQTRTCFENLLCIEIFSGSGKLTATIRKLGLRAVAVDRSSSRTTGPVMHLDLTKHDDLVFLKNFIRSERDNLIYVHLAPPCGTCSAARNKRHRNLEQAGFNLPQPLRSKLYPMGLPHIRGLDAAKVASANLLYQATFEIVMLCIKLDVLCTVENPENSLFWDTAPMKRLFEACEGFHNVFQSCMMGGDRDKRTKWWSNKNYFSAFNILCDGSHTHKAWTPTITDNGLHFPTKEEAAYPQLLCERVSHVVKSLAEELGHTPIESLFQQSQQQTSSALQHVNMGFLPRGRKLKPLVSEFSHYKTWIFHTNQTDNQVEKVMDKFPKGTRIVHRKLLQWGEVRVSDVDGHSLQNQMEFLDDHIVEKVSFGIPREPDDFVKEAIKAGHPRFLDYRSINEIDALLEQNLDAGSFEILNKRNSWLKRWTSRAQELSHDETALHRSLQPHCAAVLRGKRLLLFGEMLEEISYPDVHLIQDICEGFRITGWLRDSGCFEKIPKQPTMTVKNLLETAKGMNQAVIARAVSVEDSDLTRAAWDETQLELEKDWLWLDETNDFSGLSLTHRFGLQQKKKVRVIDNFKTSGVNATCGSPEKQKLFGLDFLATTLVRALSRNKSGEKRGLCGKTFDLSSAYKQFPLHQSDRDFIRLAVPEPGRKACAIYGVNALPFGATGSVSGFLRVSTALFHIITFGLGAWAGTFFDDFPILCRSDIVHQTERQVSLLLDLLGMKFAREGKKWVPFSEQMEVLGVVIDLSRYDQGVVYFKHTEARKTELDEAISRHLSEDRMTPKEAETLRGRLIWFEGFMFGRIANLSLHAIGKRATMMGGETRLNSELVRALTFFKTRILNGPPIEIRAALGQVIHIFTDGAFEPESDKPATIGGVLYSEAGARLGFFSEIVPSVLVDMYLTASKNPIYLIELLAALISSVIWSPAYPFRYVVNYIDNEASRSALTKAWSHVKFANNILGKFVELEMLSSWKPWFSRVPTHSNPSDAPSRLQIAELVNSGVKRFSCEWQTVLPSLIGDAHD